METHLLFSTVYAYSNKKYRNPIQKQLVAVKSARPSKAELTATKSNDIIMRPCVMCASCKINIS